MIQQTPSETEGTTEVVEVTTQFDEVTTASVVAATDSEELTTDSEEATTQPGEVATESEEVATDFEEAATESVEVATEAGEATSSIEKAPSLLAAGQAAYAATPFDRAPKNKLGLIGRTLVFAASCAVLWGAYFVWRPPLPMLFLKHSQHMGRDSRQLSITIDDAPHPLSTPLLLASLRRANVKASFFCIGGNLRLYPELAHRIVAEGHVLENHSEPHHNLTTVDPQNFPRHIDACFDSMRKTEKEAGITRQTTLFRPPGGGLNRAAMDYLYRKNYSLAWWSNNVGDWTSPPAWKIADGVKANLRGGDIILLHDGGTGTPQAIPNIVKFARKKGFEFVVMPQVKTEGTP